jgi:gliding motility-associated-like protein
VSLVVVSGNSCTDTAKVKGAVVVATSPVVIFPTAFTPNGDGLNDIFVPIHGYLSSYEIVILNRNGVVVYRSTNIDEGWDGTRNGKPCLPGMYVYKVKTTLRDKTIHFQYGHVMMYR